MVTLDFEDVFSIFHNKIDAYDFLELTIDEINTFEVEWLRSAGAKPYVRSLFSSYTFDSEDESISFEMKYAIDDDTDNDFVVEILALGMCIEWLNPKVNSMTHIYQTYGSKEERWMSEAGHMKETRALRDSWKVEQRKLIRDRGYLYNSYIEGYDA